MKKRQVLSVLLAGLVAVCGGLAAHSKRIELKMESKQKIRSLAARRPALMEALLPEEEKGTRKPLVSIPTSVRSNAVYWIKKVVSPHWLPRAIEANLVALGDAKLWEKKDKSGVVFSERVGDFLVLEYELGGNRWHIQESGVSVSVRVDFGVTQAVSGDPKPFMAKLLAEYLNLPAGVSLDMSVVSDPPFYVATTADGTVYPQEWWQSVEACTDGDFFFATVLEIDPQDENSQIQPGLPDRF